MKTALSIATSDCSGGAGIQADTKAMTLNGVYAMSVLAALTAQNTTGVAGIFSVTPEFLEQQIDMVFEDIYPDAVKVGMIPTAELYRAVGRRLRHYGAKNIVVDPVMVATSGSRLMESDAVSALKEELFPIADLVTPNIPEAEVLAGMEIHSKEDMRTAALVIGGAHGCAVLLKGGHNVSDADDLLYLPGARRDVSGKTSGTRSFPEEGPGAAKVDCSGISCGAAKALPGTDSDNAGKVCGFDTSCGQEDVIWFEGKRVDNPNTHGTGCTLSSAIAANLAKGFGLADSIRRAKDYLCGALSEMLDLGAGRGPMDHAFDLRSIFAEEVHI